MRVNNVTMEKTAEILMDVPMNVKIRYVVTVLCRNPMVKDRWNDVMMEIPITMTDVQMPVKCHIVEIE